MRADRLLERGTCLFILPLRGVNHREVVVRLGELRVVLGKLGKNVYRFPGVALLGKDKALEKGRLRMTRLVSEHPVYTLKCHLMQARLEHLSGSLQLIA